MTPEQAQFYQKQGYLVVPRLFGQDELAVWLERFEAIINGEVEPAEHMLVMRDVMVAKGVVNPKSPAEAIAKLQDFENDPVLYSYALHDRLLDWVEDFVGPDIKSIHTMLINKPPNVDGRHPLHQDLLYFPFRPANKIVAIWTALQRITKENGCLVVVPGSHRGELLKHENPDWEHLNLAYFGAAGVGRHPDRLHLEMQPGDSVFFHPLLLHGSGRNRSRSFRRAISAHFASAACAYIEGGGTSGRRPYRCVRGREYEGGI